jgi:predicted dehydrogenase
MLKVAIIGCGKIADSHIEQIRRLPNAEVVAACDLEPLMCRQFCERYGVPRQFSNPAELLREARPEVVHITTPPHCHYSLGELCLQANCHLYVEKPFTVTLDEAERLVSLATKMGRKLTVGHDLQFTHVALKMRSLIASGYLGGAPRHLESYYCYDLTDARYARALLADKNHWVRKLPGKLLHNIISHGVARIAEYIDVEAPAVMAHGFVSPFLRSLGETEIVDELRVVISDRSQTTAYFTFSSQMRPSLNEFCVYGKRNGLALDESQQTLVKLRGARLKSYAERFFPPLELGAAYVGNSLRNMLLFARREFQMKAGMYHLIRAFYESIERDAPAPIPTRQILLTSRIMEEVFRQLSARETHSHQQDKSPDGALTVRSC